MLFLYKVDILGQLSDKRKFLQREAFQLIQNRNDRK